MSFLPSELWSHILQLRRDLCYRTCRVSWKKEWLINIAVVNEEYSCNWAWNGWCLYSTQEVWNDRFRSYNYRSLHKTRSYLFSRFSEKMHIHRPKSNVSVISNFPMMHYFYSLRPEFEYKDWFLRFLASK